jgi:DNA repair protein RadC
MFSILVDKPFIAYLLAAAVLMAYKARDPITERARERVNPDPSPVEQIHAEYVDGDIGEEELESRLSYALDERAQTIRDEVEHVEGIGTTRAAEISDHFESVEAVRRASKEELQQVEHVGEKTASDVHRHFN